MINLVDESKWEQAFAGKYHSIYFDPKYLNIVKQSFGYEISYYVFLKGNNLLFAAALFSKDAKIVVPYGFTYNSIFFDKNIGDRVYLEIFGDLVRTLKIKHKKMWLRLPPEITDLRPFIWGGFHVMNRYTYFRKSTDGFSAKILKKVAQQRVGLTLEIADANDEDVDLNLETCFAHGLAKSMYPNYKTLFTQLSKKGYLKAFRIYKQGERQVTRIALIDKEASSLSTISMNVSNSTVLPFLNYEMYNWCANNKIELVDMVGANDKGVANFKYSFNAKLTPYYLVNYNRRRAIFLRLFGEIKNQLKNILGK
ncbi:hypothetical protein [Pedobacter nanyangensis]|uniref:hypothetical protein n=1 Tax=Pedobacter nanyangensis TaxID=1562389 RepID=UPI000DE4C605|nr:hypothetical protein [Pedobacter nanyangensis]